MTARRIERAGPSGQADATRRVAKLDEGHVKPPVAGGSHTMPIASATTHSQYAEANGAGDHHDVSITAGDARAQASMTTAIICPA